MPKKGLRTLPRDVLLAVRQENSKEWVPVNLIRQFVLAAERNVLFLSSQEATNPSIAILATKSKILDSKR
jgi:hypothetical protein